MNRRPGLWGIDLSSNNVQMNFRSICLDECSAASVSAVVCWWTKELDSNLSNGSSYNGIDRKRLFIGVWTIPKSTCHFLNY